MARAQVGDILRHFRCVFGGQGVITDEDGELLLRFVRARDEAAFTALVKRHGPVVLRVCRNVLHDAHDVEDAFQATFLVFVRRAGSIAWPYHLGPWLHGVAYRVASRARAQVAQRRHHERQASVMSRADTANEIDSRELGPIIEEEIHRLPEKYRLPFVLCCLQGKTNEEAAQRLGCPKGTILSRLARGRERLRKRLTSRGVTLSAAALACALPAGTASATVTAELASSTVLAGLSFGTEKSAGCVSATVAALADAVTRIMVASKLKTLAVVLLAAIFFGAGALVLGQWALHDEPTNDKPAVPPRAVAADDKDEPKTGPLVVSRNGKPRLTLAAQNWNFYKATPFIVLSADGKMLATSSGDRTAGLWELATGNLIRTFTAGDADAKAMGVVGQHLVQIAGESPEGKIHDLALSRDGKWLAGCVSTTYNGVNAPSQARIWEVATGKQVQVIQGSALCVSLSADGKVLATGGLDQTARLWDVATGKEIRAFTQDAPVAAAILTSDGKRLITGCFGRDFRTFKCFKPARLWDVDTGKEIEAFRDADSSGPLAVSDDGHWLATARDETARIWDVRTGKLVRSFAIPKEVFFLRLSGDGQRLVVAGRGGAALELRDTATGKILADTNSFSIYDSLPPSGPPADRIASIALSADAKHIVATSLYGNTRVVVWEAATGKFVRRFPDQARVPSAYLAMSSDGKWLATLLKVEAVFGDPDDRIRVWDVAQGKQSLGLKSKMKTNGILLNADGKWVVTRNSGYAELWDRAKGERLRAFQPSGALLSAAISGDGKWLATGSNRTTENIGFGILEQRANARLWDLTREPVDPPAVILPPGGLGPDGQRPRQPGVFEGHPEGVVSVALSGDGKRLATGGRTDGIARVWNSTGEEYHAFWGVGTERNTDIPAFGQAPKPTHNCLVALTQDGKFLATASSGLDALRNDGSGYWIPPVKFPHDATGREYSVRLFDLTSKKEVRTFRGHTDLLTCLAFSPDGKWLVTGSWDHTARLWETATGKQVSLFRGHADAVTHAALTGNGKRLVTSSLDGTTRVWDSAAGTELCQLLAFSDGTWGVFDKEARYDASNQGDNLGLHWVLGNETFPLNRFKNNFDPGLLAKHMEFNREPLHKVESGE